MSEAPLMVGVSGLRGIVGRSLTPEVVRRYAGAIASLLLEHAESPRVAVARDGRAGGEAITRELMHALSASGVRVHDLGVCATPTAGYAVGEFGLDAAVLATASHNPQEWNGIKLIIPTTIAGDWPEPEDAHDGAGERRVWGGGTAPPPEIARDLVERFGRGEAPEAPEAPGEIESLPGADEAHVGRVAAEMLRLGMGPIERGAGEGVRVVLDSVNSSGAATGRLLLRDYLGCDLVHLHADRSGLFPHPPEPTAENLTGLCDAVREHGAAVGFAQDPDADRLAIVDETGRYIGEEYTLVLAALALFGARGRGGVAGGGAGEGAGGGAGGASGPPRVVVCNLSTSRMIDDVAARFGARVYRTPVGEASVAGAMRTAELQGEDVVLGGEGNGGVILSSISYVRDSISAMALVLGLMAREGRPLSKIVDSLPRYAIEKRKAPLSRREDAAGSLARLAEDLGGRRGASVDLQDGVRVDFAPARSWVQARASNTEPLLRVIAEAPTEGEARALADEAERAMRGS